MKKIISALIIIVLVLNLSVNIAFAENEYPEANDSLDYLANGEEITVTGYTGNAKSLTVPDVIDGKQVTAIKENAFLDCSLLEQIVLPASLNTIGYGAFNNCASLKEIVIPEGVKRLSPNAFSNCISLEKITLNEGLTEISAQVFENCVSLKEITLPQSLIIISDYAFEGCTALTEIDIPANVKTIETGAFYKCTGIEQITVDKANTNYYVNGNCLIKTSEKKIVCGFNNSVIPSDGSVTSVSGHAFGYMEGLKEINIPASISAIYDQAFAGCGSVERITVDKGNENYHVSGNCLIETKTKRLIKGTNDSVIPLDGSIEDIVDRAFENCSGLKRIDIPSSVNNIASTAFLGCSGVEKITAASGNTVFCADGNCLIRKDWGVLLRGCNDSVIPSNIMIRRIENSAFFGCKELKKVTIPETVTEIGTYAFGGCSKLSEVVLPKALTRISGYAFEGCSSLESITVPAGVSEIENGAFKDCTNLKDVVLPSRLERISPFDMLPGTFENCASLGTVTLPNMLQIIGYAAFKNCSSLKTVIMSGKYVNTVKKDAFFGCDSLEEIYYPSTQGAWEKISIKENNDALENCNINYLCGMKKYDDAEMIAVSFFGSAVKNYKVIEDNSTVVSANGSEKQNGNFSTGDKLTVGGMTYDVAVKGDPDGSGKIDATDIIILKRDLLNINKLSGVNKIAADIDEDGSLSATDYIALKRHILGISDINDFSNK